MKRIKIAALILCITLLSVCLFACNYAPKDGVDGQGGTAENPYELDFYPQDDGTYAVAVGKGALLSKIEIPATYKGKPVTAIEASGFSGCTNLASITIPDSVTSIGGSAFYGCSSLTSIVIPDIVTSIGAAAFYDCSSLTSIVIPDSVTSIGHYAFYYCSSLTSIVIPDSITSIGDWAFRDCSSLTSIVIPDSVTIIGDSAFRGCSSLTSIEFEGTKAQWNAIYKGYKWNYNTGNYTVHCTDGDIAKSNS